MAVGSVSQVSSGGYSSYSAKSLQNEFMQLLTTQLALQTPFEPLDNSDLVSQLAQLSSLRELEVMNSNQQMSLLFLQSLNNAIAVSLIGKSVTVVEGDEFEYEPGKPVRLQFALENAAEVTVRIYDENNKLVKTIELGSKTSGTHTVTWDGSTDSGTEAQAGKYTYQVDAIDENGDPVNVVKYVSGLITGIRFREDGTPVLLMGEREIGYSEIIEIRLAEETETSSDSETTTESDTTSDDGSTDSNEGTLSSSIITNGLSSYRTAPVSSAY